MRIAILGAGYAGLAAAYHLLYSFGKTPDELLLFDAAGVGGGASGASAGLLHPFAGAHARKSARAEEAMAAARKLLTATDDSAFAETGLLRLAVSEEQKLSFKLAAEKHPEVQWLEAEQCREREPAAASAPGIFIPGALTVYPQKYLRALWEKCAARGARLEKRKILSLEELEPFDAAIIAAGAGLASLTEFRLRSIKGQALEFLWPEQIPPLKSALNSRAYIVMAEDQKRCTVGATFEREFSSESPDIEQALALLNPKIAELFPPLLQQKPVGCRAGIRTAAPDHKPIAKKIGRKLWVIGGLGSKGLLYHALLAEEICRDLQSFIFSRS